MYMAGVPDLYWKGQRHEHSFIIHLVIEIGGFITIYMVHVTTTHIEIQVRFLDQSSVRWQLADV